MSFSPRILLALSLACMPLACYAEFHKCVDANGKVSFQEQACPETSKAADTNIKNGAAALTPEEREWVAGRSELVLGTCINMLREQGSARGIDKAQGTQLCECGTRRFFANPIAKLKAIEATNDTGASRRLIFAAVSSCAREINAK